MIKRYLAPLVPVGTMVCLYLGDEANVFKLNLSLLLLYRTLVL